MTVALLATGDEIIHGDTLNTNSFHLAQILSSEGLSLGLQLVCSDKESEINDCLHFLATQHDLIIITGGLGPTSDDRTRFALAHFLNTDLSNSQLLLEHIKNRLKLSPDKLNPGNKQQALFPAGRLFFLIPMVRQWVASILGKIKYLCFCQARLANVCRCLTIMSCLY